MYKCIYPSFVINLYVLTKYTENIGNMWLIMINRQKPVINPIKNFNRFTALMKTLLGDLMYVQQTILVK